MTNPIDTAKCTGCGTSFKTCGLDVFRLDAAQPVLSPGMANCPAGIDILGCNGLMQTGRLGEASEGVLPHDRSPAGNCLRCFRRNLCRLP